MLKRLALIAAATILSTAACAAVEAVQAIDRANCGAALQSTIKPAAESKITNTTSAAPESESTRKQSINLNMANWKSNNIKTLYCFYSI